MSEALLPSRSRNSRLTREERPETSLIWLPDRSRNCNFLSLLSSSVSVIMLFFEIQLGEIGN